MSVIFNLSGFDLFAQTFSIFFVEIIFKVQKIDTVMHWENQPHWMVRVCQYFNPNFRNFCHVDNGLTKLYLSKQNYKFNSSLYLDNSSVMTIVFGYGVQLLELVVATNSTLSHFCIANMIAEYCPNLKKIHCLLHIYCERSNYFQISNEMLQDYWFKSYL